MSQLQPGRWLFLLGAIFALWVAGGCGTPKGTVGVQTTPAPAAGKIEVDAVLTAAGLEFQEKSRDAERVVVLIRSLKQDHESGNYSYAVYDVNGARLSSTGFSVPGFKKGASVEYEVRSDDLPRASRIVFGPFGK